VLIFTLLLSLVTGILFGLMPAWQASKARPAESLKSSARNLAGTAVMRWRSLLMAAEVAVSMILLIGAGLLLRSFISLNGVDLGFETEHVMAMNVTLSETSRYATADQRYAFFDELATRVGTLSGVKAVAFGNRMPMRGGWSGGFQLDTSDASLESDLQAVNPGYFDTLGIPLLRGRLLTPADRAGAPLVAIVNSAFVRSFLPNVEPLGRRIRRSRNTPWVTIVGIAGDVRRAGKAALIAPEVYFPAAQTNLYPVRLSDFAFRAGGDPKKGNNLLDKTGVSRYD
jgi:hypothetical protein